MCTAGAILFVTNNTHQELRCNTYIAKMSIDETFHATIDQIKCELDGIKNMPSWAVKSIAMYALFLIIAVTVLAVEVVLVANAMDELEP